MIKSYYNFINEGFFDFLKKNQKIVYENIERIEDIFRFVLIDHPELLEQFKSNISNIDVLNKIVVQSYIYYIERKLINKTIMFDGVKNPLGFNINKISDYKITIIRCHPEPIILRDHYLVKLYDYKSNIYYIPITKLKDIKIKRKIIKSEIDPYGEENWDE